MEIAQTQQIFTFVVSDASLNSNGFRIKTAGINTSIFTKNPICLWNHDRMIVIGKWQNLRFIENSLVADVVLDTQSSFSLDIYNKVKNGFIRTCSTASEFLKEELINGEVWITESLLAEISLVSLPANNNAVKLYKDFKSSLINSNKTVTDKQTTLDIKNLQAENAMLKRDLSNSNEMKINELVELAFSEMKITAPQKEHYLKLARLDYELAKKTIEFLPKYVPIYKQLEKANNNNEFGNSQTTNKSNKPKNEWTLTDYRKYAPQELVNNEELVKRLRAK